MWKDAEFFMFTWGHWPSGWQPKRCWGRILLGMCTTAAAFAPLSIIFHFDLLNARRVCASDTWKVLLFMHFFFRWTQMDTDGQTRISKPRFELYRGYTRQVVSCTSRWRLRGGGQIPRDIFIFAHTSEYIARQKICFDSLWRWSLKISCLILPFLGLGDMVIMYFQLWHLLLERRR